MQSIRFSVATGTGFRGAGLGNEAIAWGKSFVAAEALEARLLRPRWLANRYGLVKTMGWNRAGVAASRVATLPFSEFAITEEMYRATGEVDYGAAISQIIRNQDLPDCPIVYKSSGMWGGYASIASARPFIEQQVLSAPGVVKVLARMERYREAVNIGVHVRAGDFASSPPGPGQFNRGLPLEWYGDVIRALRAGLNGDVNFWICSDASESVLQPLTDLEGVRVVRGFGASAAVQELAVLVMTDLMVCSVSSFSMLAAFLSDKPYIWFRPQLSQTLGGLALWAHEDFQRWIGTPTQVNDSLAVPGEIGRGRPWVRGDEIDSSLFASLQQRRNDRRARTDLLYYGVVPYASTR